MSNGDRIRQMSDDELVDLIENEPWCKTGKECSYLDDCRSCLLNYIRSDDAIDILESKRDGFFECHMTSCKYIVKGRCANSCYVDCPFYSMRQSLRELIHTCEGIVTELCKK